MVSQGSSLTLSSTHDHPKSDLMSESIVQTLLEFWHCPGQPVLRSLPAGGGLFLTPNPTLSFLPTPMSNKEISSALNVQYLSSRVTLWFNI